jgi:hypothetical protein
VTAGAPHKGEKKTPTDLQIGRGLTEKETTVLQHIKVRPNWVSAYAAGIMTGSLISVVVFLAGAR